MTRALKVAYAIGIAVAVANLVTATINIHSARLVRQAAEICSAAHGPVTLRTAR